MKRILTDKQVVFAYEMYIRQNLSTIQIAKILNCSSNTIQKEFKKANLTIRNISESKRKYPINQNIFDNINSEEKAYWLGFLYADGNVSKTNRIRLSLAQKDEEMLKKYSKFIFNKLRIKTYKSKNKNRQDLVYVDVCSKYLSQKLTELGCPPNKTFILTFPNWLSINLYSHFIRGYFDGDGSISIYKDQGKYDKSSFSILSTKEFLSSLILIFNNLNINSSLSKRHKSRKNNNFTLSVYGNRQIQKLLDWLYKDATFFLQRKYNKYIALKEINNKKNI